MRQLKFRAWDKDYDYMIEPDDIHPRVMSECITGDGKVLEIIENNSYMGTEINFEDISDKRILMQYTGLQDKNGKDIYESDIVEDDGNVCGEVYWNEDHASFFVKLKVPDVIPSMKHFINLHYPVIDTPIVSTLKNFYVIGNIYENPELLSN